MTAAGATPATATDDNPAGPAPGPAGVVTDMPDEEYHARKDSLSYSGAKLLLAPSCPAKFKWDRDNVRESKPAWDRGHAVHKMVLGVGPEITVIDADDWRTKLAKEQRQEAYDAGAVPLLRKEYEPLAGMVASIRSDPMASRLFDPTRGQPEISLFMQDVETGVNLRGRVDWLPEASRSNGRMILPDLKTAASAEPGAFSRAAASFRYDIQSVYYQDLVTGLGLAEEVAFVFVVVEVEPPYVVSVIQLDDEADRIGRGLKRQAIETYRDCMETDLWPGYTTDVALVQLPRYYARQHSEDSW